MTCPILCITDFTLKNKVPLSKIEKIHEYASLQQTTFVSFRYNSNSRIIFDLKDTICKSKGKISNLKAIDTTLQ